MGRFLYISFTFFNYSRRIILLSHIYFLYLRLFICLPSASILRQRSKSLVGLLWLSSVIFEGWRVTKKRIRSKKEGSTIKAYLIKYTNQLYIKSTCLLNFSWRFWTLIVSLDSIALTSWKLIVFGNLWKSRHWW